MGGQFIQDPIKCDDMLSRSSSTPVEEEEVEKVIKGETKVILLEQVANADENDIVPKSSRSVPVVVEKDEASQDDCGSGRVKPAKPADSGSGLKSEKPTKYTLQDTPTKNDQNCESNRAKPVKPNASDSEKDAGNQDGSGSNSEKPAKSAIIEIGVKSEKPVECTLQVMSDRNDEPTADRSTLRRVRTGYDKVLRTVVDDDESTSDVHPQDRRDKEDTTTSISSPVEVKKTKLLHQGLLTIKKVVASDQGVPVKNSESSDREVSEEMQDQGVPLKYLSGNDPKVEDQGVP